MHDLLQVDILGLLHISADGIIAIIAAVLIVVATLLVSLFSRRPRGDHD
jgi:hypothetical protein